MRDNGVNPHEPGKRCRDDGNVTKAAAKGEKGGGQAVNSMGEGQTLREWYRNAPRSWDISRLRFVARLNPSRSEVRGLSDNLPVSFLPMESIGELGSLDLEDERPLGKLDSGYSYFRDGDVLIAKITPCFENGKGAVARNLCNGIGFGTTELHVLRPGPRLTPWYLFYLTHSCHFRWVGASAMYGAGGQKRVPESFVEDFFHPIPTLEEQREISGFLDRETARIDDLIAEKQRLIELLEEKGVALITRAVTGGLSPDAATRNSGVEWLGKVPVHWHVAHIGRLYRPVKRQNHPDLTVLSVYRDHGVVKKESRDDNRNKTPIDLSKYQRVEPGDLVINKMKAWQGSLGVSALFGITSPDYLVYRPQHREDSSFLHFLLRSQPMPQVYRTISDGIRPSQWRLQPDKFESLPVFLPPKGEQEKISSVLCEQTRHIERQLSTVEEAVALLREYRSALISAAVTGKIDVREATTHE